MYTQKHSLCYPGFLGLNFVDKWFTTAYRKMNTYIIHKVALYIISKTKHSSFQISFKA